MDKERKDYLLSIGEIEAAKLPRSEWYDRVRLFRQIEADQMLERISRQRVVPLNEKTSPRSYKAHSNVYKFEPK